MLPGHPSHEPTLRLHELPLSDRSKRWDPITYGDRELQGVQSSFQGVLAARCYVTPRASRACFNDGASVQLELSGFTGKEADEEVGVVYFGERYLIPRIGRWASPDPLAIHAAGGGEVLNAYHYVSGNLLQARDPIGLESEDRTSDSGGTAAPIEVNTAPEGIRYGQEFVLIPGEVPEGAERIAKHTYLAPQSTLESLKERGANSYVYNPDAKLSLETARRVEAEHGPSGLRDLANLMATMQGLVTNTPESLPGVRGIRGGETPHGSDTDGAYLAVIAAQVATAVGPPSIAKLARVAAKAAKAVAAAARRGAGAVLEGTPQSVGAMRRLIFDTEVSAQRHVPGVARTGASPGPINGQDALDSSVPIGSNTSRRVGIDYHTGDFVVFDEHAPGRFHGHVRSWGELTQRMQSTLRRSGMAGRRGRIITGND